uniref:GATA-type domain-containing protein n=1 Tax=Solanum lycopersicum TaxID=4081 RepID=A0A3Q7HB71_SOLLC
MTPPDHITPNFPFGLNNSNNNSLVTPNYHFFFNSTTNQTASFHHQHTQYYMQHEQLEVDNDGGSSYDLGKKNEVGSGLKLSLWKREDKLLSSEIKKLDQEKKKNSTNSACIKLKLGDQKQKPIQTDYCSNNIPIRVCTDCNTTKTPLWRSGPKGPKSLCNACGIRQRKARRAMAAAAAEGKTDQKKLGFEDFLINLSNKLAFQQIFPQDEMEAAILLMALSSGLVHG